MRRTLIALALLLAACGQPPRPSVDVVPPLPPVDADHVRVALQVAVAEAEFTAQRGARWESASGSGSFAPGPCVIREIDGRAIGSGSRGPITEKLQSKYFDVVHGRSAAHTDWLSLV